jgi:4-aminobutyrate--pyruvate transaminase
VVDAICFCPPMIITAVQIDALLAAFSAALDRVAADLGL